MYYPEMQWSTGIKSHKLQLFIGNERKRLYSTQYLQMDLDVFQLMVNVTSYEQTLNQFMLDVMLLYEGIVGCKIFSPDTQLILDECNNFIMTF